MDSADTHRRYRVEVDGRHFVVDQATVSLLQHLRDPIDAAELAERLSIEFGQSLSAADVQHIIDNKLPKALFQADLQPLSSPLSWQLELASATRLHPILKQTARLFNRSVAIGLLTAFVTIECSLLPTLLQPLATLTWSSAGIAFLLALLGTAIHEVGHLSACRAFQAHHGGIGFGLYWIFPTFYADVTGTWALNRRQRAVVDAAGLYFQSIYLIAIACWALLADNPIVPLAVLHLSHFMMLYTLNPVLKFDGYWILSDLSGTVNLHQRIATAARQMLRRAGPDAGPLSHTDKQLLVAFAILATAFFGNLLLLLSVNFSHSVDALLQASSAWRQFTASLAIALAALLLLMLSLRLLRALFRILT